MRKIWIVREEFRWCSLDVEEKITAFATRELAESALMKMFEETERYLAGLKLKIVDEESKMESYFGRIFTESDDSYYCWIDEIDMFNE